MNWLLWLFGEGTPSGEVPPPPPPAVGRVEWTFTPTIEATIQFAPTVDATPEFSPTLSPTITLTPR